jgi:uncharacterized protein (DUF2235 family)
VPKNIAVFIDGTWETSHTLLKDDSNVARLLDALQRDDRQIAHYVPGVGTDWWVRLRGDTFGRDLTERVVGAYEFIIEHYEPGDQVYLFGFSRGAFSARSLAGLIGAVGVLRREHARLAQSAYEAYRVATNRPEMPRHMKQSYCHPDNAIAMIGVWETVGARGIPSFLDAFDPYSHRFHNTSLGEHVRAGFQALAIDERREDFQPTLWTGTPAPGQIVEQVWFAGVHSDVGGGYSDDSSLADLTLEWMAKRAARAGLRLRSGSLPEIPQHACGGRVHDPMTSLFRLRGARPRVIRPCDAIHDSVRRRRESEACRPRYEPENLPPDARFVT